ncbi:hypothetical protein J1N35_042848 [Gossypium stocksii]|uniref:Uncharacterized protein n=1 Tax=Gossypium stocksii TaxID=47602 RepID=A0A9D3U681_9ROSI|nr:hypothetical protein J1N35_042848 [Gossypium stocksii]
MAIKSLHSCKQSYNQLDTRIDAPLKDFQERIKNEVRSEVRPELRSKLDSLFEQYFSQTPTTMVTGLVPNEGKGILGERPPGFPSREQFVVSPILDLRHTGESSHVSSLDVGSTLFRVDCPHFYGSNFRGWWSKFEKYFKSEERQGGLHQVTWDLYAKGLNERFGSNSFLDHMAKLVSLRQEGSADQFHDGFLIIEPQVGHDTDAKSPTSEEFQDCPEQLEVADQMVEIPTLVLSLHALQGSQGHKTMRFSALIDQSKVIILVDSGSIQFCGLQSS